MSFTIGKMFHVVHVTESLAPLDAFYDEVFSPVRGMMDGNFSPRDLRDGSLLGIGDSIMESMAPSDVPGADTFPVGRFQKRFGRHLHSLAWYCTGVGELWDAVAAAGIRVVSPTGERPETGDFYTHPKDTLTQLEFYERREDMPHPVDLRWEDGWDERWAASPNPLGIVRMAYQTVVTDDVDRGLRVFVEALGCEPIHSGSSPVTGTESVYVAVGPESVVEIAVPTDPASLAAQDFGRFGESCHAVGWEVRDLEVAAAHLKECGVGIVARDDETLVTDPADTFGAVFRFTTWRVPGDPRD
ncbi:MAG TPA: VOC family protein [Acidimicrobiales bacterium]|nr:VOC family protein [Acidimicrobiales bacterium]